MLVLAIEVDLLCPILVLLVWMWILIAESFELQIIHFLWLLEHNLAGGLASLHLKDRSECLRFWNHLRSSLFFGRILSIVCLVELAVVVDERGTEANIAILWDWCLTIILEITVCVDIIVIIDFLDELQLDSMSSRGAIWVRRAIWVVAIGSFRIRFISLDLSFAAVSWAGALSHLTAKTVRWIAELVWWSLWRNHLAY